LFNGYLLYFKPDTIALMSRGVALYCIHAAAFLSSLCTLVALLLLFPPNS